MAADGVREGIAVARALAAYRGSVLPRVRSGLRRWEAAAAAIPDPALRRQALGAVRQKGSNVEATAVFAILAPRRTRPAAIAAMTALQVAVDYLDTLGEQPAAEPLANGLALHEALVDALDPAASGTGDREPASRWYRHSSSADDGGYLVSLAATCQRAVATLPAAAAALPAARRAARRCGAGQSHTHGAELAAAGGENEGTAALEAWASRLEAPAGYSWRELAAGASSSVAAHALIAAAADPRTTAAEAELIDDAYFPPIGALTVLLDDLVDRDRDLALGAHNYVSYYPSGQVAADRLAFLAERARAATSELRHRHLHAAILAGVAGYYLADPATSDGFGRPAREALLTALGPSVRPIMATERLRQARRRKRPGGMGIASGP